MRGLVAGLRKGHGMGILLTSDVNRTWQTISSISGLSRSLEAVSLLRREQSLVGCPVNLLLKHVMENCDISLWHEHGLGSCIVGLRLEQDV